MGNTDLIYRNHVQLTHSVLFKVMLTLSIFQAASAALRFFANILDYIVYVK